MKFEDITVEDRRWTPRERLFLRHMFRVFERYKVENRAENALGLAKAIWIMGNLLDALEPKKSVSVESVKPAVVNQPVPAATKPNKPFPGPNTPIPVLNNPIPDYKPNSFQEFL